MIPIWKKYEGKQALCATNVGILFYRRRGGVGSVLFLKKEQGLVNKNILFASTVLFGVPHLVNIRTSGLFCEKIPIFVELLGVHPLSIRADPRDSEWA